MGAGNPEYDFVILKADGVGLTSKWSDKSSSSPHIEVDLWLTLSGLVDSRRLNNERLAIRSADRDRSRDIFSCMSFRRPFILLARANEGLEAVEDEYEAAVGGRTWKNPKSGFFIPSIYHSSYVYYLTQKKNGSLWGALFDASSTIAI